jgi:cyclomaltodextrinase / maltogenic alpha-amylase / neopullulanase
MLPKRSLLVLCASLSLAVATLFPAAEKTEVCWGQPALRALPAWMQHATIYEVNVRQYSAAGTFAAVEADLPRLRDLGVGALWFMPIHPVGELNRKGGLGSYYAVRDYLGVNPEFGTADDFRRLVGKAHALGLRVIMDWVANHTAWDNTLLQSHPDFFMRGHDGRPIPPLGFDWTDVIQLDYGNRAVWKYQIDALSLWVREFGVDGFRFDYATGVPTPFWDAMSEALHTLRPDIFLLAEAEVPQHQLRAFHASYSFTMMHAINAIAQGHAPASHVDDILAQYHVLFPERAVFLNYTTNHDENSWQGTVFERLGGGVRPFAVLSFVLDGIPLIYNGQEAGLDKRLLFFERDPIEWRAHPLAGFYRTLTQLKREHPALATGAAMARVPTTKNESIYALVREAGGRRVAAFLNLTAKDVEFDAAHARLAGDWREVFTGETLSSKGTIKLKLRSWEYRVFVSTP